MHRARIPTIFAAILLAASPACAINKCKGPDGKISFQDAPCPGLGELVADDVARRRAVADQRNAAEAQKKEEADRAARKMALRDQAREAQRQKVCNGKFYEVPAIGMTVDTWEYCTDFWQRHGSGRRVNETETAAGIRRQHVFEHAVIKYIYTTNGVITAIQR